MLGTRELGTMSLSGARSIDSPYQLATALEVDDCEQELVDQYARAMAAAGVSDGQSSRTAIVQFAMSLMAHAVDGDLR